MVECHEISIHFHLSWRLARNIKVHARMRQPRGRRRRTSQKASRGCPARRQRGFFGRRKRRSGETTSVRCATTLSAHGGHKWSASECIGIGRRHVPPRKLQRRAYAARTGSGAPARDVRYAQDRVGSQWARIVAVLMRRSLASAARRRKRLTRCRSEIWPNGHCPFLTRYGTLPFMQLCARGLRHLSAMSHACAPTTIHEFRGDQDERRARGKFHGWDEWASAWCEWSN